jgi:hypothetical protein
LTQIEAVFGSLRVIWVCDLYITAWSVGWRRTFWWPSFLAYCLPRGTLKNRLQIHAPGLSPSAVLEKLATVQMIDVWIPTLDGRWLVLPRHMQPSKELDLLLQKLNLTLPAQPPPRITATALPIAPSSVPTQPVLW